MMTPHRLLFQPICVITKNRHENYRDGNHQGGDDNHEDGAAPAKLVLAEGKGRHAVDDERNEGRDNGDDDAVLEVRPEVEAL